MQLSQKAIDDFKAIYKEEYGQEISDDEAREMGARLIRVFKVLLTTPPPEQCATGMMGDRIDRDDG